MILPGAVKYLGGPPVILVRARCGLCGKAAGRIVVPEAGTPEAMATAATWQRPTSGPVCSCAVAAPAVADLRSHVLRGAREVDGGKGPRALRLTRAMLTDAPDDGSRSRARREQRRRLVDAGGVAGAARSWAWWRERFPRDGSKH